MYLLKCCHGSFAEISTLSRSILLPISHNNIQTAAYIHCVCLPLSLIPLIIQFSINYLHYIGIYFQLLYVLYVV